jgi:hypothetical protein
MGTIKTTNIEPIATNGTVTLGSSGDTFTVPSGVTVNMSSATQTGVGGANTPAFALHKTSDQTVGTGALTTVTWDASSIDTDSGVDLSNNKYVVPSGKGGTYFLNYFVGTEHGGRWIISIKINGTVKIESDKTLDNSGIYGMYNVSGIISLSAGDEITACYYALNGSGTNIRYQNTSTAYLTKLEGYRLIT